jgi:hypothetical protein
MKAWSTGITLLVVALSVAHAEPPGGPQSSPDPSAVSDAPESATQKLRPGVPDLLKRYPDVLYSGSRKLDAGRKDGYQILSEYLREWAALHPRESFDFEQFIHANPRWPNETVDWWQNNEKLAREALSAVKPRTHLRRPVPVYKIIRYLNAEIAARRLPFHVRISVNNGDSAEYIQNMLEYSPLKPRVKGERMALFHDLQERADTLSKALREGSLYDIASALAESMLPVSRGYLKAYGSGYILIGIGPSPD